MASLPKRKEKPKQGIDKLSKLPSEGTVTMDGKTFKLSNVIAYEAFENDEWLTKIVATQRPIKQDIQSDGLSVQSSHPDLKYEAAPRSEDKGLHLAPCERNNSVMA